jgi:hypothetical protein
MHLTDCSSSNRTCTRLALATSYLLTCLPSTNLLQVSVIYSMLPCLISDLSKFFEIEMQETVRPIQRGTSTSEKTFNNLRLLTLRSQPYYIRLGLCLLVYSRTLCSMVLMNQILARPVAEFGWTAFIRQAGCTLLLLMTLPNFSIITQRTILLTS